MIIVKKVFEAIIERAKGLSYLPKDEYELTVRQATPSMIQSIQDNIKQITNLIFNAINYNYDGSIMVGSILENFGFSIITGIPNDEKVSGMIAVSCSKIAKDLPNHMIILNDEEPMGHQRFTAAHELAHFLFDYIGGNEGEYFEALSINYDEGAECELTLREYRANKFAAELLMPRLAFINRYISLENAKRSKGYIANILSEDFNVSLTAVERRIRELNIELE